jgi:hypothetical protein
LEIALKSSLVIFACGLDGRFVVFALSGDATEHRPPEQGDFAGRRRCAARLLVIAGLDPAIHHLEKSFLRR